MHQITQLILDWYKLYGRNDLPWRQHISPYRVWLSEIMLQQTQVKTVIPYFENFVLQYPSIENLANASLDEVLHLWTGLGYYSRARYLHKTAKIIQEEYAGKFPNDLNSLITLPGIGRSTAGAILAIAFKKKAAILDGNVKRVLARVFAVDDYLNNTVTLKLLWNLATDILPDTHIDSYTQASMDFGALICTRTHPKCLICPLQIICRAFQTNLQNKLPLIKKKKALPIKKIHMLIFQNKHHEILLEKRAPIGIWGNLWSLPECPMEKEKNIYTFSQQNYCIEILNFEYLDSFRHTFSHFHLDIHPLLIQIKNINGLMYQQNRIWYAYGDKINNKIKLGLPAPVVKLINFLNCHHNVIKCKTTKRKN